MDTQQRTGLRGWLFSRSSSVLLAFLAIAAFFLITEHRAHLYGILPYLLLLACPLLHLFMHGGHGGHGDGDRSAGSKDSHVEGHR
ncbi:MAG TPA: DUF2933 domain-containing protein [Candidatus Methylomirabilis sp.]|nr:DUF2933 domain-containing protein [Candidatus Methylomirabilis sp.]